MSAKSTPPDLPLPASHAMCALMVCEAVSVLLPLAQPANESGATFSKASTRGVLRSFLDVLPKLSHTNTCLLELQSLVETPGFGILESVPPAHWKG